MSETFLTRVSHSNFTQNSDLTPLQIQMDNLVSTAVDKTVDGYAFAGVLIGIGGNRLFQGGTISLFRPLANLAPIFSSVTKMTALGAGLGAEGILFEEAPRIFRAMSGNDLSSLHLFGNSGMIHGAIHSIIGLVALKTAGAVSASLNPFSQSIFQASAMVASTQAAARWGIGDASRDSTVIQFIDAEATVLRLWAGMSMLHRLTPGLTQRGQSKEMALEAMKTNVVSSRRGNAHPFLKPAALGAEGRIQEGVDPLRIRPMEMSKVEEREGVGALGQVTSDISTSRGDRPVAPTTVPADWPANLPLAWAKVSGSGMYSGREVKDTKELSEAIILDGLLPALGKEAVHSIWGYGSHLYFRNGKPEDIRTTDVDKKQDFIITGKMRAMVDNLSKYWNLSEAQRLELQDHGTFELTGNREGFIYFNPDILIPGRGPVQFKISLVDTSAFFNLKKDHLEKVHPALEYSQIRLKDASPENLLWTRGDAERVQSLAHLEAIRDEMFEQGHARIGSIIFGSLPLPSLTDIRAVIRAIKDKKPLQWFDRLILRPLLRPFSFYRFSVTGEELVRSFFTLSFRLEGYRFWENLWGPMDKGNKLFNERRDEARPILLGALQRFAVKHADTMSLRVYGREITPDQITTENMYDLFFIDHGFRQGVVGRSKRYWQGIPDYLTLQKRGYHSYKQHGLPSNLFTHAYYQQPPQEYAGRKARGIIEKSGIVGKFLNWLLSTDWAKTNRATRQIALDSKFSPVYYSQMVPFINDLFAGGRTPKEHKKFPRELKLNSREYSALMGWIANDPHLASLKNVDLLNSLTELYHSSDAYVRNGAIKLFLWIQKRPRLEPSVDSYIRSLNLGPIVPYELPSEINQIINNYYLPAINLLAAGPKPRIYQFLRDTIQLSLVHDSKRTQELIDYIDRSEQGEINKLRQMVDMRNPILDPALANEPIPPISYLPLTREPSVRIVLEDEKAAGHADTLMAKNLDNKK
jgi:hypothetical protein